MKLSKKFSKPYLLLFLILIFLLPAAVKFYPAETNYNRFNDFSLGVKGTANFSKLPYDLMMGLSVNTPYFFWNWVSLRGEADIAYLRGITNAVISNEIAIYSSSYKLGIAVKANQKTQTVRPYGEFGWIGFIPNKIETADNYAWGIYGLFGFDILFDPASIFGFFFELGATGLLYGGSAEKLVPDSDPNDGHLIPKKYGSGIIFSGGFKVYF